MKRQLDRLILETVPSAMFVERGLVLRAVLNERPATSRVAFLKMIESFVESGVIELRRTGEFWQDQLRRVEKKRAPRLNEDIASIELVADNKTILSLIQVYCEKNEISESEFGRRVVNDGSLTDRLKKDKALTTTTIKRIEKALAQ